MTLAPDLQSFVTRSIHSLWTLEVLLLLGSDSSRRWTVEELNQTERATPAIIVECLGQLRASGLATRDADAKWRYAPDSPETDALVKRLLIAGRERPFALVSLILGQREQRTDGAGK
jgi:hypothetical protein